MWLGGDELAGRQAGIRFRTIYVHVYVSYVYYIYRHQMICIISAYIHIHVQTGAMFTIYIDIIWHVSYLRIYVYMCRLASAFGLSMYIYTYNVFATQIDYTRQIPLKMLPPKNPPNPETQNLRYKFKLNQNLTLCLYSKIPRNLSFLISWFSGCIIFSWNCHIYIYVYIYIRCLLHR